MDLKYIVLAKFELTFVSVPFDLSCRKSCRQTDRQTVPAAIPAYHSVGVDFSYIDNVIVTVRRFLVHAACTLEQI